MEVSFISPIVLLGDLAAPVDHDLLVRMSQRYRHCWYVRNCRRSLKRAEKTARNREDWFFFLQALDDHVSQADAENDDLGNGVRCSKCSIPILGVLRHDIHWNALHFGCKYESEIGSTFDNLHDDTCNKMNARCSVQKNLGKPRRSNVLIREDAPNLERRSNGSALPSNTKEYQGS